MIYAVLAFSILANIAFVLAFLGVAGTITSLKKALDIARAELKLRGEVNPFTSCDNEHYQFLNRVVN